MAVEDELDAANSKIQQLKDDLFAQKELTAEREHQLAERNDWIALAWAWIQAQLNTGGSTNSGPGGHGPKDPPPPPPGSNP